jgi:hypothetical protein
MVRSAVDKKFIRTSEDFIKFVQAHKGEEINFKISRGDELLEFKLTPRANPDSKISSRINYLMSQESPFGWLSLGDSSASTH